MNGLATTTLAGTAIALVGAAPAHAAPPPETLAFTGAPAATVVPANIDGVELIVAGGGGGLGGGHSPDPRGGDAGLPTGAGVAPGGDGLPGVSNLSEPD